jgi:4-amino-4-deoxy-L-arabinose transferase-like glycosyltransferase
MALLLFAIATVWFLPGIWWGLPVDTSGTRMRAWGVDELGPWGAVDAVLAIVRHPRYDITPQYPLGQFLVQAIFVWPYYLPHYVAMMYPSVTGSIGQSLQHPSLAVLMLLHRLPSLLMAAGTVAIAYVTARRLVGVMAALLAAAAVATIGPLLYYARTSNTDSAALFWTALVFPFALTALREGLTARTAIAIGLCAGVGTATKDQQYAFFLGVGLVLIATHLLDVHARRESAGWWRGPAFGLGAAAAAYLFSSGIVLLPHAYWHHIDFITRAPDPQISQQILTLADAYHSTPATWGGYLQLAQNASRQLVAALGLPILALSAVGLVSTARSDRRLLCLLIVPPICLALGVFVPTRLVLPRYLMPIEFVLCIFAAVAIGSAHTKSLARFTLGTIAIAGVAWTALRGADLTWQMMHDSRYEAGLWLERNIQPGDVVSYYGSSFKLPRLPRSAVTVPAAGQLVSPYKEAIPRSVVTPEYLISIPQIATEREHEWNVPDATFAQLFSEASQYQQVLAIQTRALWPRPLLVVPFVNPPVRIFARRDLVPRLRDPVRVDLPSPG